MMANGKKRTQSFEEALEGLNQIVKHLEDASMPLASLIEHYTQGVQYLKVCEDCLKQAELKIQQISPRGEPVENA